MTEPWTRGEASASGQVFEFRVWAALTEQSRGSLHPFLPLTDRGVDGLIHRLTDGAYVPVQAKGRSALMDGEVHLVVWADSLMHDDVVIVSGLIVDGGLGPMMLAVPAGAFRRLAELSHTGGRAIYSMGFGMRPRSDSRWLPWLVPAERLAERFGVETGAAAIATENVLTEPAPSWRSDLGFLGESEVNRRLAEAAELNLFRPFPDLETAELGVLHLETRRTLGIQVKTVGVDAARPSATIAVRALSFRPAPTTYFVVLAWIREDRRFHDECLVIPSEELTSIAVRDAYGHLKFEFHPGVARRGRIDAFRHPTARLQEAIAGLLTAEPM
ncbi:MAG: hypothetical protein ABI959_09935 [Candidatus Dormiibacterota bacterium]